MDNFRIDLTSIGEKHLAVALNLVLGQHGTIKGYRITDDGRMILYHCDYRDREGFVPFPFKMNADGAADFVSRWLNETNYPEDEYNDTDIEQRRGFRAYCDEWGHVDGEWQACLAIEPVWALYGK